MYADGKNVRDIEQYLLDIKVFNNDKEIRHAPVKRILHNRRYFGYYVYHNQEVKGGIPQLILDELYDGDPSRLTRKKSSAV